MTTPEKLTVGDLRELADGTIYEDVHDAFIWAADEIERLQARLVRPPQRETMTTPDELAAAIATVEAAGGEVTMPEPPLSAIAKFLEEVPGLTSEGLVMSRRWAEEVAAEIQELVSFNDAERVGIQ